MIFYEWNFGTDEAIQYQRNGECNECGQCCIALIGMRTAFDRSKGESGGRNGGTGTTEKGVWSEIKIDNVSRYYQVMEIDTKNAEHRCPKLSRENKCTEHFDKENICKDWPMSPGQVKPFSDCSYSFEEIGRWNIGELE